MNNQLLLSACMHNTLLNCWCCCLQEELREAEKKKKDEEARLREEEERKKSEEEERKKKEQEEKERAEDASFKVPFDDVPEGMIVVRTHNNSCCIIHLSFWLINTLFVRHTSQHRRRSI